MISLAAKICLLKENALKVSDVTKIHCWLLVLLYQLGSTHNFQFGLISNQGIRQLYVIFSFLFQ